MFTFRTRLASDVEGTSLIETAITLPILLCMLAGAVDIGRALYMGIEVSSAAHSAAIYGISNLSDSDGISAAAAFDAVDVSALQTTSSHGCECADGTSAVESCTSTPSCPYNIVDYVEVNATSTYHSILIYPGLPRNIVLNGKARIRTAH